MPSSKLGLQAIYSEETYHSCAQAQSLLGRCVFEACRGAFRASSRTLEEWIWATVAEARTRAKEKNKNRLS